MKPRAFLNKLVVVILAVLVTSSRVAIAAPDAGAIKAKATAAKKRAADAWKTYNMYVSSNTRGISHSGQNKAAASIPAITPTKRSPASDSAPSVGTKSHVSSGPVQAQKVPTAQKKYAPKKGIA
jgi:hypothetical protein